MTGADHHYVPRFRLKKWANANGEVRTWRRVEHTGRLADSMKAVAAVAYERDLYLLKHVPDEHSQAIENDVFANTIEPRADSILEKILIHGVGSLTIEDRLWWAIFLNASHVRLPHNVLKLKESAEQHAETSFSDSDSEEEFQKIMRGAANSTLYEFAKSSYPALLDNLHLEVMLKVILKPEIIERLTNLHWDTLDVSRSINQLLLGDSGLMIVGDFWKGPLLIAVPLSPTGLFFATDSPDYLRTIRDQPRRDVVHRANVGTLCQCQKFVFGNAEHSFVDRFFLRQSACS